MGELLNFEWNGILLKKSGFQVITWKHNFFIMTPWLYPLCTPIIWKPFACSFQNRACYQGKVMTKKLSNLNFSRKNGPTYWFSTRKTYVGFVFAQTIVKISGFITVKSNYPIKPSSPCISSVWNIRQSPLFTVHAYSLANFLHAYSMH